MFALPEMSGTWLTSPFTEKRVAAGLKARSHVDPSGKIVLFEQYAPWKVRNISGPRGEHV